MSETEPPIMDRGGTSRGVLSAEVLPPLQTLKPFLLDRYHLGTYDFDSASASIPWLSILKTAISPDDLRTLVASIAFAASRSYVQANTKQSNQRKRTFLCDHCQDFKLVFGRSYKAKKNDPWFLSQPKSKMTHGPNCLRQNSIPNGGLGFPILANLTLFINFVRQQRRIGRMTSFDAVKNHLLSHNISLESVNATTFHRAYHDVLGKLRLESAEEYFKLPHYLRLFQHHNPTSSVALQVDDEGCFYRMFVSLPLAKEVFESLCIPMLFHDGCFVKIQTYDGVLLLIVAKDGHGAAVPIACAWVPAESAAHVCWVIQMLIKSGIKVEEVPIFTDRGNLLAAAVALQQSVLAITLSLKFCIEHILRNIISRFRLTTAEEILLRGLLAQVQGSTTFIRFLENMNKIVAQFSISNVSVSDDDCRRGEQIVLYLLTINPTHWTVWANRASSDESLWRPEFDGYVAEIMKACTGIQDQELLRKEVVKHVASTLPSGRPFPLFRTCRTNVVEGEVNAASIHNIRYADPPNSFLNWTKRASKILLDRIRETTFMQERNLRFPITTIGVKLYFKSINTTGLSIHSRTLLDENKRCVLEILAATDRGPPNIYICTITKDGTTCTCVDSEMLLTLCRHRKFAIKHCRDNDLIFHDDDEVLSFTNDFPTCFLLTPVELLEPMKIVLPSSWDPCQLIPAADIVHVPPRYKDVNSRSVKRHRSTGELGAANVQLSPKKIVHEDRATAQPLTLRW
jgi:hypothetical protein